jgi:hypothetical protein
VRLAGERDLGSKIWAITCLFNPSGFETRVANYKTFRTHLGIPLVTVELAFDGRFSLVRDDADILIQLSGGDRMWQKERLLNIALEALPEHCTQVVWIDADVICPDPSWVSAVSEALEDVTAVQAFTTVHHLAPMQDGGRPRDRISEGRSTMSAVGPNVSFGAVLQSTLDRASLAPCSGHVWAARKHLLQKHGLYDGCIVGGGDTAFLCAVKGEFSEVIRLHSMGPEQAERYLQWAEPVFDDFKGKVAALPYDIEHLWHGRLENRKARERHLMLSQYRFDPYSDLALTESCVWQWKSDRLELQLAVRNYFESRDEDGVLSGATV